MRFVLALLLSLISTHLCAESIVIPHSSFISEKETEAYDREESGLVWTDYSGSIAAEFYVEEEDDYTPVPKVRTPKNYRLKKCKSSAEYGEDEE